MSGYDLAFVSTIAVLGVLAVVAGLMAFCGVMGGDCHMAAGSLARMF